jgi:hypothetical protein
MDATAARDFQYIYSAIRYYPGLIRFIATINFAALTFLPGSPPTYDVMDLEDIYADMPALEDC